MKGVTLPTETVFVMENSPIKFGLGAMDEIGFDASRLGIRKALVFTDRHVAELGLPERVRALLEEQGVKADVWDGVEVEPTDRSMEEAGDYARSKEFDGLIAVGGGSTIDTCRRRTSSPPIPPRCWTTSTSRWARARRYRGRCGPSSRSRPPRGPAARPPRWR
jgi:glycerol dehydrogenase-like iron-containing ADH family enzyme